MNYSKQTWATGDTVTAEKLNHMENGIESAGGTKLYKHFIIMDDLTDSYSYLVLITNISTSFTNFNNLVDSIVNGNGIISAHLERDLYGTGGLKFVNLECSNDEGRTLTLVYYYNNNLTRDSFTSSTNFNDIVTIL